MGVVLLKLHSRWKLSGQLVETVFLVYQLTKACQYTLIGCPVQLHSDVPARRKQNHVILGCVVGVMHDLATYLCNQPSQSAKRFNQRVV